MLDKTYKTYFIISLFFIYINSFAQDQEIADSLIAVYEQSDIDTANEFEVLRTIAFNSTNPEISLDYANKLIDLANADSSFIWLYRGYLQRGSAYRLMGDYKDAISSLFLSAKFAKKANYQSGLAAAYTAIGDTYNATDNHKNSSLYYKKAIAEFRSLNDSTELATALLNIGDEYFNHDEIDSALVYLLESKEIFSNIKYKIGVAYAVGNIGLVYAKLGDHELAEGHIKQATEILEGLGDLYPIAVYQTYMANIYKEKGELPIAIDHAKTSLRIASEGGFKEQIRDASLKLSELYRTVANFEKAYNYQSQYLAYRDSINNEETIRKIADLRTDYEVSKKQIEVDLLNQIAENHRFLVINLILMVLLIGALAYLYYHRSQVRLKLNQLKSSQKLEMESQRDQLELLNETKDKFFSIISHDLRAPVANFKGVSSLMTMLVEANDKDDLVKLCERLDKSASELIDLLDNLLQWAMSQQGRFPFKPEKISAYELVSSTFMVLENMAKNKKIEMDHFIAGPIDLFVDRNSTETIIRNLLSNALKFTPERGIVSLSIGVSVNMAEIKVTDNGTGMTPDVVTSLFDFKAKQSKWGTAGEKGVGLGLTLVNDFSKMNGGSVEVQSEVGHGTTFTVYLPLYQ